MVFLRKYGAAATIDGIPLITRGAVDIKTTPTLAAGDAKVSKDGGALANPTTLPAETPAGSGLVRIALSATEMQAARVVVKLVDQTATKEWEDQIIIVETYGNASATHAADLNDSVRLGLTALPNAAAEAAGGLYTRGTGAGQVNQPANGQIDCNVAALTNAVFTAAKFAAGAIDAAAIADNAIDAAALAADCITAAKIAAGAIDADALATDAVQEIWDRATTSLTTMGSVGKLLVDNLNATVASRSSHSAADVWAAGTRTLTAATNLTSTGGTITVSSGSVSVYDFTAAAKSLIQTEAEDALVAHRLDELLNADSDIDGAAPPTVGSVFHELMTKTAGAFTFDQATDSLEALRDRGDAAWTTATGFSTLDAAGVRAAVGLAAANLDTQLTAIDDLVDTEVAAIKAKTDQLTFTTANRVDCQVYGMQTGVITAAAHAAGAIDAAALAADAAIEIRDAVWAQTIETGVTAKQAVAVIAAACVGVLAGAATTTVTIAAANNSGTNRVSATVDANGNRSAVTLTLP